MRRIYLYLGKKTEVKVGDIIGIFDLEATTTQKKTREFLYGKEKEGKVTNVSDGMIPKSFTLVQSKEEGERVYVGPLLVSTLGSRLEIPEKINEILRKRRRRKRLKNFHMQSGEDR